MKKKAVSDVSTDSNDVGVEQDADSASNLVRRSARVQASAPKTYASVLIGDSEESGDDDDEFVDAVDDNVDAGGSSDDEFRAPSAAAKSKDSKTSTASAKKPKLVVELTGERAPSGKVAATRAALHGGVFFQNVKETDVRVTEQPAAPQQSTDLLFAVDVAAIVSAVSRSNDFTSALSTFLRCVGDESVDLRDAALEQMKALLIERGHHCLLQCIEPLVAKHSANAHVQFFVDGITTTALKASVRAARSGKAKSKLSDALQALTASDVIHDNRILKGQLKEVSKSVVSLALSSPLARCVMASVVIVGMLDAIGKTDTPVTIVDVGDSDVTEVLSAVANADEGVRGDSEVQRVAAQVGVAATTADRAAAARAAAAAAADAGFDETVGERVAQQVDDSLGADFCAARQHGAAAFDAQIGARVSSATQSLDERLDALRVRVVNAPIEADFMTVAAAVHHVRQSAREQEADEERSEQLQSRKLAVIVGVDADLLALALLSATTTERGNIAFAYVKSGQYFMSSLSTIATVHAHKLQVSSDVAAAAVGLAHMLSGNDWLDGLQTGVRVQKWLPKVGFVCCAVF